MIDRMFRSLWILLMLCLFVEGKADTLLVQSSLIKENITKHFEMLVDSSLNIDYQAALDSDEFENITSNFINRGMVQEHFWFRIHLRSEVERELYIEIPQPHINRIKSYTYSNQSISIEETNEFGDHFPFDKRIYQHRNLIFPIELDSNELKTICFFIDRKNEPLNVSFNLWEKSAFEKADKSSLSFYGIILGWQMLYLIWIIVFALVLSQRMLWYYLMFIGFVFLYSLFNTGLFYQFVWRNVEGGWGGLLFQFSIFGLGLGLLLFNQRFFKIKEQFPRLNKAFNVLIFLTLIFNVPHFIIIPLTSNYSPFYEQLVFITFTLEYLVLAVSFILCSILPFMAFAKNRSREYLLFMISYLFYGLYIGVMVLGAIGLIEAGFYSKLGPEVTTIIVMIEITMFTIAVFLRIYSLNEERKRLALEIAETKLEAAQAKLDGQAIERKRISRDLHDNVGAQLTNIIYSLNIIEYQAAQKKVEAVAQNVNALEEKVQNTTQLLRDTIWAINQDSFTIPEFYQKTSQYLQVYLAENEELDFKIDISGEQRIELTSSQALHLFRILQEALQNTVKYAQASLFLIQMNIEKDHLELLIKDNGVGMQLTYDISDEHYGLLNMQERAKEIDATLTITTNLNEGVEIQINLPIPQNK